MTEMIKRYGWVGWEAFDEKEDGLYVLYDDHLAAIAAKDRIIDFLKELRFPHEMLNAEDDRRDGCQDPAGAEGAGHDQPRADCDGGDSDWLADLEAKQREYDDHCCFELDKRLEREIREGSIE